MIFLMPKMISFPTQHTIKHNSVDFKFGEKKKTEFLWDACINPVESQTL